MKATSHLASFLRGNFGSVEVYKQKFDECVGS